MLFIRLRKTILGPDTYQTKQSIKDTILTSALLALYEAFESGFIPVDLTILLSVFAMAVATTSRHIHRSDS